MHEYVHVLEVITANSYNCSYAVNCNGVKMHVHGIYYVRACMHETERLRAVSLCEVMTSRDGNLLCNRTSRDGNPLRDREPRLVGCERLAGSKSQHPAFL